MSRTSLALVLLATTAGQAVATDLPTIGSPAPTLKVDTWVKGDPVSGIEKGKVYVIEFWQTTCVPCIKKEKGTRKKRGKEKKGKGLVTTTPSRQYSFLHTFSYIYDDLTIVIIRSLTCKNEYQH